MTMTERNPTEVAACGCPYDPEYDAGSLGWHLAENHIREAIHHLQGMAYEMNAELGRLEMAFAARDGVEVASGTEGESR